MRTLRAFTFLLLLLSFPLCAQAQQYKGQIPGGSLGKPTVEKIASRPMTTYRNGVKTTLTQAFNFVAISFKEKLISKEARHAYYKRMQLVVSELDEAAARAKSLWVVRLTDGATEEKWNIFAAYMENDRELDYVGRVFILKNKNAANDLLVAGRELSITFKKTPSPAEIEAVTRSYPLTALPHDPISPTVPFVLRDIHTDSIDLANRLHESGQFAAAEVDFVLLHGKVVDEAYREKVMEGYRAAKPNNAPSTEPPPMVTPKPQLPQYNPELQKNKKKAPAPAK